MTAGFTSLPFQPILGEAKLMHRDVLHSVHTADTTAIPGMSVKTDSTGQIVGAVYADGTRVICGRSMSGEKYSMVSSPNGNHWMLHHSGMIFVLD